MLALVAALLLAQDPVQAKYCAGGSGGAQKTNGEVAVRR